MHIPDYHPSSRSKLLIEKIVKKSKYDSWNEYLEAHIGKVADQIKRYPSRSID